VVAAGDARVVSSKFKKAFGMKPRMLKREDAEGVVGHAPGGVCPFAVKPGVGVYLDESLKRFDTVFPACGSSNSAIELSCDELVRLSEADGWVDVCRIPDEAAG
jgi:prolyl-tRNA editing enzyme YbaK/EbsC (Cys-tRNA(Pro) deacylase)